ncbi:polyprenyl synthetase family protein [Litorimonas sp. RW-G-Af-16]|uniref:polyprenyl synthetase family protein n=1 Tax=Litorimonas sp. RW-G-Af-16 TaxID=3241168 RepID=UPI00390C64F8
MSECAARIEVVLDALLPVTQGHQAVIMEAMRYAALGGGKRLRPFLVIETAKMLGASGKAVEATAAALECLHVYSLVHDDLPCMDDDDLRRGKPTVHKAYDEAMAVLAGDGLLTVAFEMIATCDADPATRVQLIAMLAKAGGTHGMIGGQVIDMTVAEKERDEALITQLQNLKTGALIEYAVLAGAVLAGASDDQKSALQSYARDMGLAFQIKDDILDVEGDAEIVGKAVGKDENLGKATFVSILGLEGARKTAAELGARAKSHLAPFGENAQTLCDTVDFVIGRSH